mgnify:CR=1 FL=1
MVGQVNKVVVEVALVALALVHQVLIQLLMVQELVETERQIQLQDHL